MICIKCGGYVSIVDLKCTVCGKDYDVENDNMYVKLKHVQELVKIIEIRDGFDFYTDEYKKYDKKVKELIDWIEDNAKEM